MCRPRQDYLTHEYEGSGHAFASNYSMPAEWTGKAMLTAASIHKAALEKPQSMRFPLLLSSHKYNFGSEAFFNNVLYYRSSKLNRY